MNPALVLDLLNRALTEELGLVVDTPNPKLMEVRIHEVKTASKPKYDSIMVTIPSTPNTIMLVKKSVELDEPVWGEPGDLPDV